MKSGYFFHGLPEIKFHRDGISLGKTYSLRLSNLPKNIQFIAHSAVNLSTKTSAIFLASLALMIKSAKADDCLFPTLSSIQDVYLNHSTENAFLLVKHIKGDDFSQTLNNICGFFKANKQLGTYSQLACLCEGGDVPTYQVIVYGQNITSEMIKCIKKAIDCSAGWEDLIKLGIVMLLVACCCTSIICYIKRGKAAPENKVLSDQPIRRPQLYRGINTLSVPLIRNNSTNSSLSDDFLTLRI